MNKSTISSNLIKIVDKKAIKEIASICCAYKSGFFLRKNIFFMIEDRVSIIVTLSSIFYDKSL